MQLGSRQISLATYEGWNSAPAASRCRRGEAGDARAVAVVHLTLPRLRRGPLPLPPRA